MKSKRMKPILIGRRLVAVEYIDVAKARAEGLANPGRTWRHDAEDKNSSVWGFPAGSLITMPDGTTYKLKKRFTIMASGKHHLWDYR